MTLVMEHILLDAAKVNLDLYTANDLERWLVSAYYVLCTSTYVVYGGVL